MTERYQKAKVSVTVSEGSETEELFNYSTSQFNHENILRQWRKIKNRLLLQLETAKAFPRVERIHITNITNSWYVATECFGIQR